jgi:hypothetical protein
MNKIPHLRRILNKSFQKPDPESIPAIPIALNAQPKAVAQQVDVPAIVLGENGLKRVLDIGNDQAAPITRNEAKRLRLQQVIHNAENELLALD